MFKLGLGGERRYSVSRSVRTGAQALGNGCRHTGRLNCARLAFPISLPSVVTMGDKGVYRNASLVRLHRDSCAFRSQHRDLEAWSLLVTSSERLAGKTLETEGRGLKQISNMRRAEQRGLEADKEEYK